MKEMECSFEMTKQGAVLTKKNGQKVNCNLQVNVPMIAPAKSGVKGAQRREDSKEPTDLTDKKTTLSITSSNSSAFGEESLSATVKIRLNHGRLLPRLFLVHNYD